jgi:hypothetical protein
VKAADIAINEPTVLSPLIFRFDSVLITTRVTPKKDTIIPKYPMPLSFSFRIAAAKSATKIVLDATNIEFAEAGISRRAEKLKFG